MPSTSPEEHTVGPVQPGPRTADQSRLLYQGGAPVLGCWPLGGPEWGCRGAWQAGAPPQAVGALPAAGWGASGRAAWRALPAAWPAWRPAGGQGQDPTDRAVKAQTEGWVAQGCRGRQHAAGSAVNADAWGELTVCHWKAPYSSKHAPLLVQQIALDIQLR